ncbi:MAG: CPBP family intramembrane glutamic endopeptidase [Armatimonadota bacterium]|nr:CPBP family intramembrane glutamic endopeptidase [Armatimonadota bacterium]MDR7451302.1 CPBP family intramembrane glutamic endopeptidase [Armatimonadota bacterium]MDR7466795.1 CPBP family intramembrane glutamic endopeptidase [Armatimonadota bacterium]MDR7492732.1 CPBP family intramembrane glutamic endopeptidase [Armatimonadota bacterium]MDR7498508.1 CPBP family intramembrane glutamic endopeptidase [Armatimonadota bacterium]
MSDELYRLGKLALALTFVGTGIICPSGGSANAAAGGFAGTALYALLARALPQVDLSVLRAPAVWTVLLGSVADEILWRGWLTAPAVQKAVLPYAVVGSTLGFAFAHLPRQGLRGAAVHLLTGAVFATVMLVLGFAAAATAHVSYNLWVLMARTGACRTGQRGVRDGR